MNPDISIKRLFISDLSKLDAVSQRTNAEKDNIAIKMATRGHVRWAIRAARE
jgi:hypothetical protein